GVAGTPTACLRLPNTKTNYLLGISACKPKSWKAPTYRGGVYPKQGCSDASSCQSRSDDVDTRRPSSVPRLLPPHLGHCSASASSSRVKLHIGLRSGSAQLRFRAKIRFGDDHRLRRQTLTKSKAMRPSCSRRPNADATVPNRPEPI